MSWPVRTARALWHPLEWSTDRVRSTDAMLVTGNRRHWWFVALFDLAMFLASVVAWWNLVRTHLPSWWALVASVLVGLQLGRTGIMSLRRATAYRSGWLAGRSTMVHALIEAERRGLSPQQWLEGELERDWAVLLGADHWGRPAKSKRGPDDPPPES